MGKNRKPCGIATSESWQGFQQPTMGELHTIDGNGRANKRSIVQHLAWYMVSPALNAIGLIQTRWRVTFATQCSCDEDEFRIYWIWWVGITESLNMLCQIFESTQTNNTQHPHFWVYSGYSGYLILKILARRSRHGRQEGSRCRSGCGHEPKSQGEKTDERFQVAWPKHLWFT